MRSARGRKTEHRDDEVVYSLRVRRGLFEDFRAVAAQDERTIAQALRVVMQEHVKRNTERQAA